MLQSQPNCSFDDDALKLKAKELSDVILSKSNCLSTFQVIQLLWKQVGDNLEENENLHEEILKIINKLNSLKEELNPFTDFLPLKQQVEQDFSIKQNAFLKSMEKLTILKSQNEGLQSEIKALKEKQEQNLRKTREKKFDLNQIIQQLAQEKSITEFEMEKDETSHKTAVLSEQISALEKELGALSLSENELTPLKESKEDVVSKNKEKLENEIKLLQQNKADIMKLVNSPVKSISTNAKANLQKIDISIEEIQLKISALSLSENKLTPLEESKEDVPSENKKQLENEIKLLQQSKADIMKLVNSPVKAIQASAKTKLQKIESSIEEIQSKINMQIPTTSNVLISEKIVMKENQQNPELYQKQAALLSELKEEKCSLQQKQLDLEQKIKDLHEQNTLRETLQIELDDAEEKRQTLKNEQEQKEKQQEQIEQEIIKLSYIQSKGVKPVITEHFFNQFQYFNITVESLNQMINSLIFLLEDFNQQLNQENYFIQKKTKVNEEIAKLSTCQQFKNLNQHFNFFLQITSKTDYHSLSKQQFL